MNDYAAGSIVQDGVIRIVSCKEKGRSYVLRNTSGKNIQKIHVDGNLIKSGTKCDYAVDVSGGEVVYLVELKGSDKEHAFEQLTSTLDYFYKKFDTKNYYCRAVLSKDKSPNLIGKFEKLLIKAIKEKKCISYDTACVVYDKDRV